MLERMVDVDCRHATLTPFNETSNVEGLLSLSALSHCMSHRMVLPALHPPNPTETMVVFEKCLTAPAGVHSRLLAAEQKLGCMMAASTARRALAAWRAHMVAAAHERAAEAEQLCKQRIQEARKTEIACQFHRVWHMHSVLKYWRATTQEIVATRTAAAHAALAEAALAARMEIAEKFRNNYQLHASMDTWRRAVPALKQERRASEQAQLVQSRIDAVLARVRAAKQSGKQLPWSDIPATQSEQHTAQPSAAELDIGSDAAPELSEGHPSLPTAPELHLTVRTAIVTERIAKV